MNEKEQEAATVEATIRDAEKMYAMACQRGFDAGIQHSRLPADGWREINGEEDLPKEAGWYCAVERGFSWDRLWFDPDAPGRVADWLESVTHWRPITPPTEGETNNAG